MSRYVLQVGNARPGANAIISVGEMLREDAELAKQGTTIAGRIPIE